MLDTFIGNDRVVHWLRRAVATEQISHAYLLTGPDQIGKRTLALGLAQLILCAERGPGGDHACGVCLACRKVEHGNHPDLALMTLPKDKQQYSIEQIRDLIEHSSLKPAEGSRRIFIIPDADRLTLPALQASLKVIEEPPPSAMIILTSASTELLLPTIVSRCQQVPLMPLAPEELAPALMSRFILDENQAREMALLSGGRPGWAIAAAEHPEIVEEQRQILHDLAALAQASRAERIAAGSRFAADREQARRTITLWLPWWRDVALAAHGAGDIIRHADDRAMIEAQARDCGAPAAEGFIRAQTQALEALDQNGNPRLVFDVLLQAMP